MPEKQRLRFYNYIHRISILIGILTIVLPFVFWKHIPNQIPLHYNAAGVVDNWADKSSIILIAFCIAIMIGLMCIAVYVVKVNMMSKYTADDEKTELTIAYPMVICMNLVMQLMFAYIMICVTTGRSLGKLFLPIVMVAVFAPVVYFFLKRPKKSAKRYQDAEKEEVGLVYQSAVDRWLGFILGGTMLWMLYLTIEPIVKTGRIEWMVTITTVVIIGLLLPLFRIRYVFYSKHLLVSCSLYGKARICYKDIINVKKTRNPISSAALSVNRLQIDYIEDGVKRMVLISPVRRTEFLNELEERRNQEND